MSDTLEVAHVIHRKEDFLAALNIDDMFWYMSSRRNRPHTIEGPFKVVDFALRGKQQFLNVQCEITRGRVQCIEYYSIGDLTNEHHGVFTTQKEAWTYFKQKRAAYDRMNPPTRR